MSHPRILIQLDTDRHASVFDAVVATDSQVEQLLQYSQINADNVVPLVHGAMFTRGPDALKNTAIFIGGSDVTAGDAIAEKVAKTFFGPIRVSVLRDGNGSNTTAAAAVLCAARHIELPDKCAVVLGGTGPVGGRVARLLARQGVRVWVGSRRIERAQETCRDLMTRVGASQAEQLHPFSSEDSQQMQDALSNSQMVFSCGAAGVELLTQETLDVANGVRVAIDLNAVPPAGIGGIGVTDKGVSREGRVDYGAIGVGGLKMKIHRACIQRLFTTNELLMDAEEVFDTGLELENARKQASD